MVLQSIDQLLDLFRVTRAGGNAVGPVSTGPILRFDVSVYITTVTLLCAHLAPLTGACGGTTQ